MSNCNLQHSAEYRSALLKMKAMSFVNVLRRAIGAPATIVGSGHGYLLGPDRAVGLAAAAGCRLHSCWVSVGAPDGGWRGLLAPSMSPDQVRRSATDVAAVALSDMRVTVQDQARMWASPVSRILQKPLPMDTSNKEQPAVVLELLDPADGRSAVEPLFERVWKQLRQSLTATAQRSSMLLLTGAPGTGKTKVAFDIGREYAFVVMVHVGGQSDLTAPWQLLRDVTKRLQAQSRRTGEQPIHSANNRSSVAALMLLLSCHLEWATMVYRAAMDDIQRSSDDAADERVLREVALRAQRSDAGHVAVRALFAQRLSEAMTVGPDGCAMVSVEAACERLRKLVLSAVPSRLPLVWCYDEVQAMLTEAAFDGFFDGALGPALLPLRVAPQSLTVSDSSNPACADTLRPSFWALPEDVAACSLDARRSAALGWFYGLLTAARLATQEVRGAHLFCGSDLRLTREIFQLHNAAQGATELVDADTCLTKDQLRAWLQKYLTPAAAMGLDEELLGKLAGRPGFGSCVFEQLQAASNLGSQEPAEVARAALALAVEDATGKARRRVQELWDSSFTTAGGDRPQLLVAWLYYLQRMGLGTSCDITPPSTSAEVMDAVRFGVLHVSRNDDVIELAREPFTAAAILQVGDERTMGAQVAIDALLEVKTRLDTSLLRAVFQKFLDDDRVLLALKRRVDGFCTEHWSVATAEKDVVAWALFRRAQRGPVPLKDLLAPFLGDDGLSLFPPSLEGHTVHLEDGVACEFALGPHYSSSRTLLDPLERPDGHRLLLHRAKNDRAGADMAFLVQRPRASPDEACKQRLVLVHVNNDARETAWGMLSSVNLGYWYPDATVSTKNADGTTSVAMVESASHVAMRKVLEAHPDWADPVRVLLSTRPWHRDTVHTAAWVNVGVVPAQPVLLGQITKYNVGVDIGKNGRRLSDLHPPHDPLAWWPTRVRHWPQAAAGPTHPQLDTLPRGPSFGSVASYLPSCRVRFTCADAQELRALAESLAGHRSVSTLASQLGCCIVEYVRPLDAMAAVAGAEAGALRLMGGDRISAVFVRT